MAYKGYIVEVKELREHTNASKLQIATVFNSDVVVGLDVLEGDKMLYLPTDGQVDYDFALHAGLLREDKEGHKLSGYLDPKKRNIKAIRLRGEQSDGVLIPIETLESFTNTKLNVGDTVDTVDTIGGKVICQKYVPATRVKEMPDNKKGNKTMSKKAKYPLFKEHVDTQQFAYNLSKFRPGDLVTMTLKLHGTSGRTTYTKQTVKPNFLHKLFKLQPKQPFKTVSGTRRVILDDFGGGYYGDNTFRKQYHDYFEGKLNKGETVFYEIVGSLANGKSIMPTVHNKKLNDKEFIKKYGEFTNFTYGSELGKSDIYVYRMNVTDEDGNVVEYPTSLIKTRCEQMGVKMVPVIEQFFMESEEDLQEKVEMFTEGADPIGKTHIREGVVLRIENREKFEVYKNKSFTFKLLEGIIKEEAVEADIEEIQDFAEAVTE